MPEFTNLPEANVRRALGNPQWEWRTLGGIARETGLPEYEVAKVLKQLGDQVEAGKTRKGQEVYRLRLVRPIVPSRSSADSRDIWEYVTKRSANS
jgi:hypothetical protein